MHVSALRRENVKVVAVSGRIDHLNAAAFYVKHGTPAATDNHVYLGIVSVIDRSIALTHEHRTPQYDPFAKVSSAHTNPNIDKREIGGLGVPLILRLTERARYAALPQGNRITLVFRPRGLIPH